MSETTSAFPFGLSEGKRALLRRLLADERRRMGPEASEDGDASPIPRRQDRGQAPLSYAQERLWFLDQLAPGNPFYNCDVVLPVGELDPGVLGRALTTIVRRHDQLRCAFVRTEDGPRQVITEAARASVKLELVDLRRVPPARRQEAAEQTAGRLARQPFDLAAGPLLRAALIRLDPGHHLLVLVIHHIVCDGWSIGVLVRELWACYADELAGRRPRLVSLPIEYADFAAWQRSWLSGDRLQRQLAYWDAQLAGMRELALPTDRMRPPVPSYRGAYIPLRLPASLVARLRELARAEGATTFMVLFAAFCALLSRYAGTDDVAVGAPIANRHRRELEGVVGFFVNTLVLRVSLAGEPSFRAVVARTRDTALAAYRHQDMPFERLVQHLRPDRDLSRNPLVQVIAQHFQTARSELAGQGGGNGSAPPELARGTAKFDLRLDTWDAPDGIRGQFEYSLDLFERRTAVSILTAYVRLLQAALADPDRPLAGIDVTSPAERALVIRTFNHTARPYEFGGGVHRAVQGQARARPGAVAIDDGTTRLTYGELWAAAGTVATALRARGLAPGTLVGVALDRGANLVVAQLGILRAGCAYVPLDPGYPPARLAMMLDDSRPAVVVTERRLSGSLPPGAGDVLLLDEPARRAGEPDAGCAAATPEQLAYLMYTSGSTGRPKGVRIPHRGISRLATSTDYVTIGPRDAVGFASNVSFDAATWEIWAALVNGARLVTIDRDTLLTPPAFALRLREGRVTALFITTALFTKVVEEVPDAFATLDTLMIGGSVFDIPAARRMFAAGPPGRFLNMYGPTENTTFSTAHLLTGPPEPDRPVPIGRPIANSTTYVVDASGRPVPVSMPGELWVGGDGVGLGYHERPDLTAARFVPDRFGGRPGALLYRTGDRVRLRHDGAIEFLGRTDRQTKIRGFRVELAEVEAALRAHPNVGDVVVEARRRPTGDPRLVAYVRVAGERDPAGGEGHRAAAGDDELVSQWRRFYDEVLYALADGRAQARGEPGGDADVNAAPRTEDFSGWVSSYTGRPIAADTMREQVGAMVEQVLARRPRRVLDIGCGSGLLAYPLVPHLDRYVGMDFSARAVDTLRRGLAAQGHAPRAVRIERLAADELERLEGEDPFEVVLLNSVVQYFPSAEYLDRVLRAAVECTADGGVVIVGDARLLPLLRAFHTSVAAAQAPDDLTVEALDRRVTSRLEQDNELVLAPAYYHRLAEGLPGVTAVTVELKRGRADSELTRFRADIHLEVGGPPAVALPSRALRWRAGTDRVEDIERRLRRDAPQALLIQGLPNARLAADHALLQALARARPTAAARAVAEAASRAPAGVHPDDVRALAAPLGYEVRLTCTPGRETETFDVLALRRGPSGRVPRMTFPASVRGRSNAPAATDPRRGNFLRRVVPELREFAAACLPDYMQPSAWVLLHEFPVDANGKVDTARLPPVDDAAAAPVNAHEPPRTELERVIAEVWASVLGLDRVGLRDGFFTELGANSLLATQVISRLRKRLGVEVPLRALFEHPTVQGLAAQAARLGPPAVDDDLITASSTADPHGSPPDAPIDVNQLSDEGVDALLNRLLAEPGGRGAKS
jgi:amino acid adenylation domain-containing protein